MLRIRSLPYAFATLMMTFPTWAQAADDRNPAPPPTSAHAIYVTQQKGDRPVVIIKTSKGIIKAELYADKAPISVKNFLQYVDDKFYDHTIFHRVIDGFMIQGGGFTKDMDQKPTREPIKNEADNGEKNLAGTLAMARTPIVDSATAQFFINVSDNAFLDFKGKSDQAYGYAVFGKVVEGMDVVDAIKSVKTGNSGPFQNVPVDPVEILEITRAP